MTQRSEGQDPLISFCILAYNQEMYIREAVNGAFSQTYTPLEIILSDDGSTDDTFEIMKEMTDKYTGNHIVTLNRNYNNLGIGNHINKIFKIKKGEYLITVGGDDIPLKNHAKIASKYIKKYKKANMIDFSGKIIDEKNNIISDIEYSRTKESKNLNNYLLEKKMDSFAPGRIIHKRLYEIFGELNSDTPTEDSVYVLRSFLTGEHIRVNENVIFYRRHSASLSCQNSLKKMNYKAINKQYLDDINKALCKGYINNNQYINLIKRIKFEQINQKIYWTSTISKAPINVKRILMHINFKIYQNMLTNLKECTHNK